MISLDALRLFYLEKNKMRKLKRRAPFCQCGCGERVRLKHHKFIHGHNVKIIPSDILGKRFKEGVLKKYGVDNIQKIPSIKRKTVETRKQKYSHWMGNLDKNGIKTLKENCKKAGKIGGKKTAERWKKNPKEFKKFLDLSHQKQRDNGSYEKRKGSKNIMSNPKVKIKHKLAVQKAMKRPEVRKKISKTAYLRTPFIPRKENHYRWKGGVSFSRGLGWAIIRKGILIRDKFKCIVCKNHNNLHIHHIIPVSSGIDIDQLNDPFNLITLCRRCHMKHEFTNCFEKEIIKYLNKWGESLQGGLSYEQAWL